MMRSRTGSLGDRWGRFLAAARPLARRPGRAVLGAFLVGFLGAAALTWVRGVPLPAVHDEFAYLLGAETFASGRLTNPTHRFWQHFETFHVIHRPTYQSKYPPGQALTLAPGSWVGEPAVGLWISSGLLAATLLLVLLAWLPRHWAVLVAAVATPHLIWLSYWGTSYWGGAVAASGGALALAGAGMSRGRFALTPRWAPVPVAAGLAILALTRPFEGLVFAVGLAFAEGVRLVRGQPCLFRPIDVRAAWMGVGVLAAAMAWLGYYNERTTGSPTTMPYQVHEEEYAATSPLMAGGSRAMPEYRHPEMEVYWREWGTERVEEYRGRRLDVWFQIQRAGRVLIFLFGPGLILMVGLLFQRAALLRRSGTPAVTLVLVLGAVLLTAGAYPHYAAPATASGLVLAGGGILGFRRRARREGLPDIVPLALVIWVAATGGRAVVQDPVSPYAEARAQLVARLEEAPGDDLVLVTYGPGYDMHAEWVYNAADIDEASIVWARSMAPEANRALLSYFANRKVWCLYVTEEAVVSPLSETGDCGYESEVKTATVSPDRRRSPGDSPPVPTRSTR